MSRQIIVQHEGKEISRTFDLRTHHRDKSGDVIKETPYTLIVKNGHKVFIDKATGIKYFENGDLVPDAPVVVEAPVVPEVPQTSPVATVEPAVKVEPAQAAKIQGASLKK